MSIRNFLKEALPYSWRKQALDIIRPTRSGIGPVLRRMNHDMDIIFDIGANVGDISSLMLYYFPRATVYSFEPCSSTYKRMLYNISKTGYQDRSRTFQYGFYDEQKEAQLNIASFHGANSILELSKDFSELHPHIKQVESEQISLVRMDDFVVCQGIEKIDLVKIDVEGVELQILKGGEQTFTTKVGSVVMEISFIRNQRDSGEFINLFKMMHDYGFAPAEIYDLAHTDLKGEKTLVQFDCLFKRR